MKNTFYFILGICLIVLTSATTVSVMTIKPATPISVVCFPSGDCEILKEKINLYSKRGYVVKTISSASSDSSLWYKFIVIMEKY